MKVWSNGKIIDGKVQIDSLNYGLHYGAPICWEGIRSYTQSSGDTKIFKLQEHISRLHDSAKILGITLPYDVATLVQACRDVVEANGNGDLYLRPIVYPTQDAESVHAQEQLISVDIYAFPIPKLHKSGDEGIKMGISNLIRGYPQFNMQCKTAPNYSMLEVATQQARALGVHDVFLTDNQGYITEATVANVWVFKGDVAMTPPNNGSILPGITRKTLAELLQSDKMFSRYKRTPLVVEKQLTKADLYTADCIVICGTYAEVVNVVEVDGRKIGSKEAHTYFRILKDEYSKLTRGILNGNERSDN